MPGVGITPRSTTSMPAEARPAATAASRKWPEMRGSRPTTAKGRCPSNWPASASTRAAETARSRASEAVSVSPFARPRTPSVPKRRVIQSRRSALRELRGLAGLLETSLLALHDASVAGEQAGLLQGRTVGLDVDGVERTGDAQAQRAGLAG